MPIDPTRSLDIHSRSAGHSGEVGDARAKTSTGKPGRRDQVEISDEARALAQESTVDRAPFTEARVAEIRDRLESGFYDRPEVVGEIAQRLADSGDL